MPRRSTAVSVAASKKAQRTRKRKPVAYWVEYFERKVGNPPWQWTECGYRVSKENGLPLTAAEAKLIMNAGDYMATKAIGKEYKLTKDGKVVKTPVFHNVSQKLKARRTNRTRVKVVRRTGA